MKKLALLFAAGISLATAKAQVQFGVKAGANFSNLRFSDKGGASISDKVDFNGGVLVNIHLVGGFSLQPEVVYSGQGAKFSESGTDGKYSFAYINVPVLLKYKLACGFFAETGPQLGILASAKAKADGSSTDIKSQLKSTDFAWTLGVGYMLPVIHLGIDVRYNLGLNNIDKDNADSKIKNGTLQAGVFFLFGGGK